MFLTKKNLFVVCIYSQRMLLSGVHFSFSRSVLCPNLVENSCTAEVALVEVIVGKISLDCCTVRSNTLDLTLGMDLCWDPWQTDRIERLLLIDSGSFATVADLSSDYR